MSPDHSARPQTSREVARRWDITPIDYLNGGHNQHWLVEHRGSRLVLRGYMKEPFEDIAYELEVMRRLAALGWPIPAVVEAPIPIDGRTWCLFTFLRGAPRTSTNSWEERRARGRLLAQLNESAATLQGMGQRKGFSLSDQVISDPELIPAIREYARIDPGEAHILRWHLDRAQESFELIDLEDAETILLHGDFAPWNLLFEGERLTGILDFEATHLNYRVADFANSWRGYQDELIDGYQEIHRLNELDWQLLVPVYWSWMFLGVKDAIKAMVSGKAPTHDFEWQVRHLMRREGILGERADRYPGPKSGLY